VAQEKNCIYFLIRNMYKEIIKDFKENFLIKNPLKRNIDFPYEILDLNKIITFV
jgi:hypothetical protein